MLTLYDSGVEGSPCLVASVSSGLVCLVAYPRGGGLGVQAFLARGLWCSRPGRPFTFGMPGDDGSALPSAVLAQRSLSLWPDADLSGLLAAADSFASDQSRLLLVEVMGS